MDTPNTLLTGADVFKVLIGVSIGLIPTLVTRWLDRKKSFVEVREAETRADLNIASTRSTELRDDLATGEGVGRMLESLINTGDQLYDLQQQLFEWKGRTLRAEADADVARLFVEQLHAAAKLKGVHLADFTPEQLKRAKDHSYKESD